MLFPDQESDKIVFRLEIPYDHMHNHQADLRELLSFYFEFSFLGIERNGRVKFVYTNDESTALTSGATSETSVARS